MAEIKEVFEDVKDAVGDKGFLILIAGVIAVFFFNLLNSKEEEPETLTTVTHVTSYPDAMTNANVIIDTLQDSIDYAQTDLEYQIQGMGDELTETLTNNFEATNDYINKGLDSQADMLEKQYTEMQGSINKTQTMVTQARDKIESSIESHLPDMWGKKLEPLQNDVREIKKEVENIKLQSTTIPKKSADAVTVKNSSKKLNVDTSIVDALKSIGVDSSMNSRKKIAKKNGIKNYTGTAEQNMKLLDMFKAGKLKY